MTLSILKLSIKTYNDIVHIVYDGTKHSVTHHNDTLHKKRSKTTFGRMTLSVIPLCIKEFSMTTLSITVVIVITIKSNALLCVS